MSSRLGRIALTVRTVPLACAGLGLCALSASAGWAAAHPFSIEWMIGGAAVLLILASMLGWWASSATSAALSSRLGVESEPAVGDSPPPAQPASQMEATLLARLHVAIEAADIAPWEFDLIGNRFVWLGARLSAFGTEGISARDHLEALLRFIVPEDRSTLHDEIAKAIAADADVLSFRYRMNGIDNKIHHIQSFLRIQRSDHRRPYRLVGASWDITEQVEANARIQHQAEHQQALLDRLSMATQCAGIGFWEMDLVARCFVWVDNPVKSLGMDESAFGSLESFAERVAPEDRMLLPDAIKRSLKDGTRRFELRYRVLAPTGHVVHVQTFGRVLTNESGRPIRAVGVSWDVSAEVAAAEALLRTEAAEAASAAKSAFLINMSHEIRTPMNGVVGMTALLLDTPLDGIQREYAETIRSSGKSLIAIINDILDFSQIQAGKLELASIELSLGEVMEEIRALMGSQAAVKGVELSVDVHEELTVPVLGDPHRLRQCLVNLVGNAVKFTSSGEIAVKAFPCGLAGNPRMIQFEVSDTGIGIEANTIKALFQPFVQADSSTTRRFGGTGLGLSIVQRLVELMGGKMSVSSELGHGSVFSFCIPLQVVQRPLAVIQPAGVRVCLIKSVRSPAMLSEGIGIASMETPTFGGHVLIVEDNAVNQKVAKRILERMGCTVHTADDGLEGVEAFTTQRFDLVLMDLQMPVLDGIAATRRIRALPNGDRVIIVALTANATQTEAERCQAAGMNGFLTKPIDVGLLRSTLVGLGLSLHDSPITASHSGGNASAADALAGAA